MCQVCNLFCYWVAVRCLDMGVVASRCCAVFCGWLADDLPVLWCLFLACGEKCLHGAECLLRKGIKRCCKSYVKTVILSPFLLYFALHALHNSLKMLNFVVWKHLSIKCETPINIHIRHRDNRVGHSMQPYSQRQTQSKQRGSAH